MENKNGDVTVIHSTEAGTQIILHQDSLTDYCSISSDCSVEPLGWDSSSSVGRESLASHSSVPFSADQEETGRDLDQQVSNNVESYLDSADKMPQQQAFAVLPVNGTLWIPRYEMVHTH